MKMIRLSRAITGGVLLSLFWIIACYFYYYSHRYVEFEKVAELYDMEFRWRSSYRAEYVCDKDELMYILVENRERYYKPDASTNDVPYDTDMVLSLAQSMDFEKYDYIITYNRELEKLVYAPYLSDCMEDLMWQEKISLIPLYQGVTDYVYIYRIKKMDRDVFFDYFFDYF